MASGECGECGRWLAIDAIYCDKCGVHVSGEASDLPVTDDVLLPFFRAFASVADNVENVDLWPPIE